MSVVSKSQVGSTIGQNVIYMLLLKERHVYHKLQVKLCHGL